MLFKGKRVVTFLCLSTILIGCAQQPDDRSTIASSPPPDIAGKGLARNPGASGRVTGEGLKNLRKGPGVNFSIKSQVKPGQSFKVLRTSSDANGYQWFLIRTSKGTEGWIAGNLITLD
jgi:uncharacterized protein YgiM (DUF1202 family)